MSKRLACALLRFHLRQLERRIELSRFDALVFAEIDRVRAALELLR
jgi:hypothetical protein